MTTLLKEKVTSYVQKRSIEDHEAANKEKRAAIPAAAEGESRLPLVRNVSLDDLIARLLKIPIADLSNMPLSQDDQVSVKLDTADSGGEKVASAETAETATASAAAGADEKDHAAGEAGNGKEGDDDGDAVSQLKLETLHDKWSGDITSSTSRLIAVGVRIAETGLARMGHGVQI